ncbi:MAG: sigma-54-dependent Fis family transcriptional regulator [Bacteroidetes bacterium HGW-Bacteroidetes-17]|jgi:DNA-binding NtrC family response regulator|nr:MAG: sigma-54-dependent Fis family transcriptional regulator [Bacteroidetes bacterium HGW-Bacteroidetes-17]
MNPTKGKILIIDDNESILLTLKQSLKYEFEEIETVRNPNLIPNLLNEKDWDLILLDMNFKAGVNSGNEGLFWLRKIKESNPEILVILITAYSEVDIAVKGIKEGAYDFITKPWDIDKLIASLHAALKLREAERKVKKLKGFQEVLIENSLNVQNDFLGSSPKMTEVFKTIRKVAATDANILILGENGTGKELVASEIHKFSGRKKELFVSVDLGSINENLFESEMFGHKKGAFTDAQSDRTGRFVAASGGTLFLDEITNLSMNLQSKLLRVLQSREVIPVGSDKALKIDIRLISATNKNPFLLMDQELFREDLLYRLNTIKIEIPPLRERGDDILIIADFYLKRYSKKYNKGEIKISSTGIDALLNHSWPGNVRELKHTIEKAVILAESDILRPEDFRIEIKPNNNWDLGSSNKLADVEKYIVKKVLDKHQGNLTKAAQELNISRTTLYLKIEKHGL